jgi:hypothetical protein
LTANRQYLGLIAGILAILLVAWLLAVQVEEFGFW